MFFEELWKHVDLAVAKKKIKVSFIKKVRKLGLAIIKNFI